MYHLTRYKYWFFGVSLAIILPGLLALAVWGLNLGIDFTGGSTINLSFASKNITTTQIQKAFTDAGGKDVHVFIGTDLSGGIKPEQYAYLTFSRPISADERDKVISLLNDPKSGLSQATAYRTYYSVTAPGATTSTALMIVQFASPLTSTGAITTALQNLPPTAPPPLGTVAAQDTSSATPGATATPGASTTTITGTFPVSLAAAQLGANNKTYKIDTQTAFNTGNATTKNQISLNKVLYSLIQQAGPAYVQQSSSVGPAIGSETTRNAFFAVAAAAIAISLFIGIAFRKVGSVKEALRFGVSAIVALLHDVLVVLGLWAIFGHFFDFKVDSLFLTAVLTVIGFSVHDTIVVFDRIRENLARRSSETFETIVDASLVQTMSRSLNTSLTVLFTLAALTLFGGITIREFTLALLIGIMSGTYSSIFNASMILVVWVTGEYRTWFRRAPKATAAPAKRELAGTRG